MNHRKVFVFLIYEYIYRHIWFVGTYNYLIICVYKCTYFYINVYWNVCFVWVCIHNYMHSLIHVKATQSGWNHKKSVIFFGFLYMTIWFLISDIILSPLPWLFSFCCKLPPPPSTNASVVNSLPVPVPRLFLLLLPTPLAHPVPLLVLLTASLSPVPRLFPLPPPPLKYRCSCC